MATLQDRIKEVMEAMGWTHADVMRVSKQSSSAVSQWRGTGNGKIIQSIKSVEGAVNLERASGYNAAWIAQGKLPKKIGVAPAAEPQAAPPDLLRLNGLSGEALELASQWDGIKSRAEKTRLQLQVVLAASGKVDQAETAEPVRPKVARGRKPAPRAKS